MTAHADEWLEKLAKMETAKDKVPNLNENPGSDGPDPVFDDPLPRRRPIKGTIIVAIAVAFLFLGVGVGYAVFSFSQSVNITSGSPPVIGPASFNVGPIAACTSSCNGTYVTATGGAVRFNVVAVRAVYSYFGVTPSGVYLILHTLGNACGSSAPNGAIQVPQTEAAISVQATAYDYCIYYTSVPTNATFSIAVSYSV